jgi:capsid portal protein
MKKRQKKQPKQTNMTASAPQKMEAFTFGEPPRLDRRDILDYVECINNGKWYEPPVKLLRAGEKPARRRAPQLPIYVKRNILTSTFIPHPLLSRQDFSRFVLDYLVFANGYLEKRMSVTGQLMKLETSPAKYTRRGVEDGVYWYVSTLPSRTSSPRFGVSPAGARYQSGALRDAGIPERAQFRLAE